jgi:hypothetical protein
LLCYCGRAKDPTVDDKTRREVAGLTPSRVSRFIFAGLLDESQPNPGVFEVHDWPKYQPKDATNAERQAQWRSRKQAKNTVTPPVTQNVTEFVTPSRAGVTVPSRTTEVRAMEEVLSANGSETTREGLPVEKEMLIAKLLAFVGDDTEDREATAGTIRGLSRQLSQGSLVKVEESTHFAVVETTRARYVVGALKSEIAEREQVKA